MRMPNGYGAVIKLSGKRRKPFAVRVTTGVRNVGTEEKPVARQTYKYLQYFEKRADAMRYLADYNAGADIKEYIPASGVPTFAECYDRWIEEKSKMKGGLSASCLRSHNAAFKKFSEIHYRRISTIRYADVQPIINEYSGMSKSSVEAMLVVLRGISAYAYKWEYTTVDFARHAKGIGKPAEKIHVPFQQYEIEKLWKCKDDVGVKFALITIYTGMRPSELLLLKPENIHLEERYMIAGIKTKNGIDRTIPLHTKIIPFIREIKENGAPWENTGIVSFRKKYWDKGMEKVGLDHLPDDGRHTCATLMEKKDVPLLRRKLILGHSVRDITEGTYTHVPVSELIQEIEKI